MKRIFEMVRSHWRVGLLVLISFICIDNGLWRIISVSRCTACISTPHDVHTQQQIRLFIHYALYIALADFPTGRYRSYQGGVRRSHFIGRLYQSCATRRHSGETTILIAFTARDFVGLLGLCRILTFR